MDYEHHERQQALNEAISTLTPEARIVVVLCYLEGLSYKEIATICGISVETIKSHLRCAKFKLRNPLASYREETV